MVATVGKVQGAGTNVTQQGAAEIQQTAEALLSTLRVQGGKAASDAARTSVQCRIINAAPPAPVPAYGGL